VSGPCMYEGKRCDTQGVRGSYGLGQKGKEKKECTSDKTMKKGFLIHDTRRETHGGLLGQREPTR